MREWFMNVMSAVLGTSKMVIRKDQTVNMNELQKFLSLFPNNPEAKVINSSAHTNVLEFRIEVPRLRMSKEQKKEAKSKRTWAGGRL